MDQALIHTAAEMIIGAIALLVFVIGAELYERNKRRGPWR